MSYYLDTSKISHNMVSAVLIGIAAMVFTVSPVSLSLSANGGVSLAKVALADDINADTHASANSVIGLLAIYKQSFNQTDNVGADKSEPIRKKIAGMEMDLSNPYLDSEEQNSLQMDIAKAEYELATIEMLEVDPEKPIAHMMMSKINSLLGIDLDEEIDISEASGTAER